MVKTQNQKINIFKSALDTDALEITINDYFKGILEGRWQDVVLKCRAINDKNLQSKFKKSEVPAITASGFFSGRKDSDLVEHSGLLVIDIDSQDQNKDINSIKESLKEIPELFALHHSLRGEGLAAYFKINKAKHFESFEAISKLLINDYNVLPDMHCSNVARLRFVSYDPDCYLNFGASTYKVYVKNTTTKEENKYDNMIFSENDIDYVFKQIKERQLNIASDYYSWLRIGFALADKLGAGGREDFELLSRYHHGKQKITPSKQYDRCLRSGKSGISISTFFYYAKSAGCDIVSSRTKKITTIAKIRKKQEQSTESGSMVNGKIDARKYLDEFEGITGKDVDDILDQVWSKPLSDIENLEGQLYDIEVFLKSNYEIRLNDITGKVEVNGEDINDYLLNSMYLRSLRVVDEKISKERIYDLIHSDFTPKYNPLMEWFEKHKHLKPKGNIKKLIECIASPLTKTDPTFVPYFLEKWLISIIASAHGTYSILCLVLTGEKHGTGKSKFFKNLLPGELSWLFATNNLDGSESNVAQLMCSKLLILDDEFGGKSKQDEKKFKALIANDKFSIRRPYSKYIEDMTRLAVLCGTSNEEHVINDLTGNRRIIPISVDYLDIKAYEQIDKKELFIELYHKYRKDPEGFFLQKEDIERLNEVCYEANQITPEMELPLVYFSNNINQDGRAKFMSSSQIRSYIEIRTSLRLSQQKLSIALKKLNYKYDTQRIEGRLCRGFWVIEKMESSFENTINNHVNQDEKFPF